MKYRLEVSQILEFGQRTDSEGRPHQEDSIFPAMGRVDASDRLFILCDGMGGHDAGEVASAAVCDAMSASILAADPDGPFTAEMLDKAVADAYRALDERDTGGAKKMGTTLTLLKFHSAGATIAHMGDSRVYQLRCEDGKGRIVFRTSDHSLVEQLVRLGEITPKEAAHHPRKNVITRAMQPHLEEPFRPTVHETSDIREGDIFYMCSDGMLEQMTDEQLCDLLCAPSTSVEQKAAQLVEATESNADNHSAFIIRVARVSGAKDAKKRRLWLWTAAVVAIVAALVVVLSKLLAE